MCSGTNEKKQPEGTVADSITEFRATDIYTIHEDMHNTYTFATAI
jgi:hypothetical protein